MVRKSIRFRDVQCCRASVCRLAFVVKVDDSFVKKGINAGQIVNKLATATGGKGGGRPQFAQGAGKDRTNLRTVLTEVEKEIKQLV